MEPVLERDDELARLKTWLGEADTARGRVVFVGGEAGIGKTTLVTALARDADGARTAIGRCDALRTPRALGPVLEVARALGLDAPDDRDALLGCLLADLRGRGATLIVVEDAHWADDATVELLAMLGRRAGELPLLLVVTYRDDDVAAHHPLRLVLGDLVTASRTAVLSLQPLSLAAVDALAAPHGLAGEELHRRTGGNPFFVTEALAAPDEDLPSSIRLAVLARAARLDAGARAVLDAVAVVPGRAEHWLVEAMSRPAAGDVDACVLRGMLVDEDGAYAFRHELGRLAVEAELSVTARRDLHRRAVAALTARPGVDPARVAHHAELAGDDRTLARAASRACHLAADRTAYREAVRHGERALSVGHALDPDERAELQVKLGHSLAACAHVEEAGALLRAAVDHWHETGDDRREADALSRLGIVLGTAGQSGAATVAAERARILLEGHPPGPELALAYQRLTSLHMLARDRDQAAAWGERAIALARRLGDTYTLGRALIDSGIADVMAGRLDGLDRVREGMEIGRQHDLPGLVSAGLGQIGSGCGELRRYDLAVPALVEGVAFDHEHGFELNRRYVVAWLARCQFDLGQWSEAESHAREALGASWSGGIARFVALNTLGWLRARRGEDDVWSLLDEALAIARATAHLQRLWPVAVARAEAGALEGELEPHLALLVEVLGLARRCRHEVAIGEIGYWLHQAGAVTDKDVVGASDSFARSLAGDHLGSAAAFRRMGCPYEAARELAATGDVASLREALATFRRLGAAPAAATVAGELRARGARVPAGRAPNAGGAGTGTARGPERAGGRGAQARGGGLQQPPDRHVALHQPQDGRAPRVEHPGQAGCHDAHRGGRDGGAAGRRRGVIAPADG